jgi:hypothetical protein
VGCNSEGEKVMAKLQGQFPVGIPSGRVNLAVQRPTVNLHEAENLAAQTEAESHPNVTFSKHATFGPKKITHPGLETED